MNLIGSSPWRRLEDVGGEGGRETGLLSLQVNNADRRTQRLQLEDNAAILNWRGLTTKEGKHPIQYSDVESRWAF